MFKMLSFKVYCVPCSTFKRKSLCVPSILTTDIRRGLLPFKDIPLAPSFPIVRSLPYVLAAGGQTKFHKYIDALHKKLGPIFIDRGANKDLIFISDPQATLKMYEAEGKHPMHLLHPLWTEHVQQKKMKRGLLFMDGEEWRCSRDASGFMNKITYTEDQERDLIMITKELMEIWKKTPPKDLKYDLYFWYLECVGVHALGRRFGFLEKVRFFNRYNIAHVEENNLIKAAFYFDDTLDCYLPIKIRRLLNTKSYRNYCKYAQIEMDTVSKYVEKAIQEVMSKNPSEMAKRSLLYKYISDGSLELGTIKGILIDMVISAAFSISNAGAWALYVLGRHPEIAEKVRQQAISASLEGPLKVFALENKVPLINGAIKESLRLYPTAPQLNRITTEDTELYGYFVPKESIVLASTYTMGRDPKNFSYPESFLPERWSVQNMREKNITKNHARNAFFPFSHRLRNCIGRRIAQSDLKILLLETVKTFEWTTDEVDTSMKFVLVPSKPIELRMRPLV